MSILLNTEFYQQNDDNYMIDEILTFFGAGMKTIQVSTTNLIYYLTKHSEIKKKLLNEILPPVQEAADNIVENLSYETVMEFKYLSQCYSESLRIEPPVSNSIPQMFTKDSVINV